MTRLESITSTKPIVSPCNSEHGVVDEFVITMVLAPFRTVRRAGGSGINLRRKKTSDGVKSTVASGTDAQHSGTRTEDRGGRLCLRR